MLTPLMGVASFASVDTNDDILGRTALASSKPFKASDLRDETVKTFIEMLATGKKPTELKLDGTHLTNTGAKELANYIRNSGIGMSVKKISFKNNPGVTDEGIAALKHACSSGMYKIAFVANDEDEAAFQRARLAKASEDAIPYLVAPLAGIKGLKARDLDDSNIKEALPRFAKKTEWNLDGTQLTDTGAKILANYITSSAIGMSVKKISFKDNPGVTAEGIAALEKACSSGMYKIEFVK